MVDLAALRTKMVDGQVRPNDVTDLRIIDAMLAIPRDLFVLPADRDLAYIDRNLTVAPGRVLPQAMIVAKLVQAADIQPTDRVLEVGTATGYGAALLARLAGAVTALEEDAGLAAAAATALAAAGAGTVAVVSGPLSDGWKAGAPYDVILVSGAVELIPDALTAQLADGGRLLCVEGHGQAARGMLYTRSGKDVSGRVLMNAALPLLPGFSRRPEFVF